MTGTSNTQPIPYVVFGSSIGPMEDYLRRSLNATDDELEYLKTILDLRMKERPPLPPGRSGYGSPSIVIDDFLYHGDLNQASNIGLLNSLGIRHIVSVCDFSLEKSITDKCNVLWINLSDDIGADVKQYFDQTNKFLYECKEKNEKVLVHCQMGISRSSSIILAYLMKYHHDTLYKAYNYLLERRRIAVPNYSFFIQLIRYENELRATREIDETKNIDDQQNPIKTVDPTLETNNQ
jgi:protein-tyrosine phosphatase